ncbi:flagellar export protein FliJ [Neobacillus mesonae]|uniref:flagellar export protein FliJ n=1 Tax=Neobacillus mesonae TaxID=1193713 RepID=UPI002E1D8BF3|nr:flagellar export protein FliJ [Neobacillus mesonae]MED4203788.1 flagellar export protein FliJ [Neobacillus mesonae]
MTFHFPYKHILNLKEKEKDQALLEMSVIVRKREAVMEEFQSIDGKRQGVLEQIESASGQISIADIQRRKEYFTYLTRMAVELEKQIHQIDEDIARKKAELLAKQQEEKTWHHLRDKAFEKYSQLQKKLEQEAMDEMAAIRHFHQRLSS